MTILIETERLRLRRWRDGDLNPFSEICADPEVMRHIADGSVRTKEQTDVSIKNMEKCWEEYGFGLFAVERMDTRELIGFTGLSIPHFLPEVLPSVEIGWRLSRASWCLGFATEAARAALEFGNKEKGLTNIVSICRPANTASIAVMQKIGLVFDRETTEPEHRQPVLVYRLSKTH